MGLSRRNFLGGVVVAGGALLSGCGKPARLPDLPAVQSPALWRALSRLTFGPRPDELARAAAIGLNGWIEEQLAPAGLDDQGCELRLARLDTPWLDQSLVNEIRPENLRADLRAATLIRATYSRRQLYEVMVDFWSDHFSVFSEKERVGELKVIDDREVIRRHALGRFDELLWASMSSPAMLISLDNVENRAGRPNENYARELLELHSLGVDAGYTQGDVQEVARCLTGWAVDKDGLWRGALQFVPGHHDNGAKQIFGRLVAAGGGAGDPATVHSLLMAHQALPRFIARKLIRRLVGEPPAPALVDRAAQAFKASGFQISALLRAILEAPEFAVAPPRLKRPLHLVAGALRQLDAEADGGAEAQAALAAMGQPLFGWPTPDGFPDHDAAWAGALLPRWRFATALAGGELRGVQLDLPELVANSGAHSLAGWIDHLATVLLGGPLPPTAARTLLNALGSELSERSAAMGLAALLASPQYQWQGS